MRKVFAAYLLSVLTFVGCQNLDLEEKNIASKSFVATIDDGYNVETKTSLDANGNVLWKKGDRISIFAGSTINQQYQVTDASDGKTSADLTQIQGSFVAGTEIDNNVAVYPYSSTASISKEADVYVLSGIQLPATQSYAESSFANGAFPMAAVTNTVEDLNLKFKNILGGLNLQLKGSSVITSISINGNGNEILCGAASVTIAGGTVPQISLTDGSAQTVNLDCGAGVHLNEQNATSFIVALPPMTFSSGFTVIVTDNEGKQMEITTDKPQTITRSSILKMPAVEYVGKEVSIEPDYANEPLTFTSVGNTEICVTYPYPREIVPITLEYKKNEEQWRTYTIGVYNSDYSIDYNYIALSDGETLQFQAGDGGNESFGTQSNFYTFGIRGSVKISGNLMSIMNKSFQKINRPCVFYRLFAANWSTIDASKLILPAVVSPACYMEMFCDCKKLTSAPELPATNLADGCYQNMFYKCTNLKSAPKLPATTLKCDCYNSMFSNCSSLTSAPELPATTLASSCYKSMFYGCSSLTSAPELPATTLEYSCYNSMFRGCSSLTSAPELSATTLDSSCYESMFSGCSSLTSAPELPAKNLVEDCYHRMFYNCNKLKYVKALFISYKREDCLSGMLEGVAADGTFVKSKEATWNDSDIVPSGWTVEIE